MYFGLYEQNFAAVIVFGVAVNFLFSLLFGWYLSQNIGTEEMMRTRGAKRPSPWMALTLVIPYARMLVVLYRIAILQLYFLNRGYSHKAFWIYLTSEKESS